MMHGSYANHSERSRRAVVINAMGHNTQGNTAGYHRLDALSTFPAMPQDQQLNSRFFPLLFDVKDPRLETLLNKIPVLDPQSV